MSLSRRGVLIGSVGVGAIAAGVGAASWMHGAGGAQGAQSPLPAAFWDQRFEQPEGGTLALSALRGKPVLINFWATWCPPCIEEMPLLERFHKERAAAAGWQVVGLAIDQPSAVRKYLARAPVSYAIGMAGMQGTELVRSLGNTQGSLPFTLMIGRAGQVAARKIGQLTQAELEAWQRVDSRS